MDLGERLLAGARRDGDARRVVQREPEAREIEPTIPVRREHLRRDPEARQCAIDDHGERRGRLDPEGVPRGQDDSVAPIHDPGRIPRELVRATRLLLDAERGYWRAVRVD